MRWLDALAQDVRFALRMLRRNPTFTPVAVLTLGIGIGANTAVFSLVEAVLLRPLPYHEPDRLFMLWTVEAKSQHEMNSSYPDYRDWREQSRLFEDSAAFHGDSFNLTGEPEPERVDVLRITPGLLELLQIQPVLGRSLAQDDDQRVALLSHRLWIHRFGGSPSIVGAPIHLDGQAYIVLGVLPPGFHFPPQRFMGEPELFVPLIPNLDRTGWSLRVIGRLKPGVSHQQAQTEMSGIAAGIGAGAIGAWWLTRFLVNYLYAVKSTDIVTFILIGFVLFAVAVMAIVVPARRATKIDPLEALRYE